MTRLLSYWPWATAALILIGLAVYVTYTGLPADSRKQEKAKVARQQVATQSAAATYHSATLTADSATRTHEKPLTPLAGTDTAGILRVWADLTRPAHHPRLAPAGAGSGSRR